MNCLRAPRSMGAVAVLPFPGTLSFFHLPQLSVPTSVTLLRNAAPLEMKHDIYMTLNSLFGIQNRKSKGNEGNRRNSNMLGGARDGQATTAGSER